MKHKLTDYKLQEIETSARNVCRSCTGCYEEGRKQQSREVSDMVPKKVKSFCSEEKMNSSCTKTYRFRKDEY
jgi:hypothetical protein